MNGYFAFMGPSSMLAKLRDVRTRIGAALKVVAATKSPTDADYEAVS